MSKGKRRPLVKFRRPPAIVEADESADFINFDDIKPAVKLMRQAFAREYLKDFNATQAVLRMGYKYGRTTASTKGSQWLNDAYTQHYIAELIEKADEKTIVSRNRVLAGLLRESEYFGEDGGAASRISALRSLAKILGMEITKIEGNMTIGGGVMAIPLSGSPEEWEKAAQVAQEQLKKTVRV